MCNYVGRGHRFHGVGELHNHDGQIGVFMRPLGVGIGDHCGMIAGPWCGVTSADVGDIITRSRYGDITGPLRGMMSVDVGDVITTRGGRCYDRNYGTT